MNNTDATMMAINNFLTHSIKGIDIKRYGDDLQNVPTEKSIRIMDILTQY